MMNLYLVYSAPSHIILFNSSFSAENIKILDRLYATIRFLTISIQPQKRQLGVLVKCLLSLLFIDKLIKHLVKKLDLLKFLCKGKLIMVKIRILSPIY